MSVTLRINNDIKYPRFEYNGHIYGIQDVPPSEFEKETFLFIDATITSEQEEDIKKGRNHWAFDSEIYLLDEKYWIIDPPTPVDDKVEVI